MTDTPKKRALVVRGFKNEGTGERFAKGATPQFDAGTFANYEAAGLITAAPPTKSTAATKPAKPRTKSKAASKPKSKAGASAATAIAANATTLGAAIGAPVQAPASDASASANGAN